MNKKRQWQQKILDNLPIIRTGTWTSATSIGPRKNCVLSNAAHNTAYIRYVAAHKFWKLCWSMRRILHVCALVLMRTVTYTIQVCALLNRNQIRTCATVYIANSFWRCRRVVAHYARDHVLISQVYFVGYVTY